MTSTATNPTRRSAPLSAALALLVFLLAATLPYIWLIEHFGYDDILREPAAAILAGVARGGTPLVLAWFAFAMSALLFIPVAVTLARLGDDSTLGRTALALGVASAIAQAAGLLRWVLVVPPLAASFVDPQASAATRDAVIVVFDAVHRYGGMVLGEMVGQLLLAGWTGLMAHQLWRTRAVPRGLALAGALTIPLWLLGQTELLHDVAPTVPQFEVVPLAFMAWEAWLAALAAALLIRGTRGWHATPSLVPIPASCSASPAPLHRQTACRSPHSGTPGA
jgi:hypothetical protein